MDEFSCHHDLVRSFKKEKVKLTVHSQGSQPEKTTLSIWLMIQAVTCSPVGKLRVEWDVSGILLIP